MKRVCVGLMLGYVVLAMPSVGVSQQRVVAASSASEPVDIVLARPVTVRIKNVPLRQALHMVAEAAKVRVQYQIDQVEAIRVLISIDAINEPLGMALERMLRGIPLHVVPVTEDAVTIRAGTPVLPVADGTIIGTVRHGTTRKPIVGATVVVGDPERTISVNADGTFRVSLPAGEQRVAIRAVGFGRQIRKVTVYEGAAAIVDVFLEPATSVLDEVVVTGTVVATERKAIPNAITVITARQIEERGITRIEQLFRGDVPGLFAVNLGSLSDKFDRVAVFSRGATTFEQAAFVPTGTPLKTYVDGVEMVDPGFIGQIDMRSVDRIEILAGPQASTIYGSNAINGVIQIFTKRGSGLRPQLTANLMSGLIQNNYNSATTPMHTYNARVIGGDGRWSYSAGGSWDYMGAWTPAKQYQQMGMDGGLRVEMGTLVADGSARRARTRNRVYGDKTQGYYDNIARGIFQQTASGERVPPAQNTADGETFGVTIRYSPRRWWSHELVLGRDESNTQALDLEAGYRYDLPPIDFGFGFIFPGDADTSRVLNESIMVRYSQRYTTSAQVALPAVGRLSLSLGGDRWKSRNTSMVSSGLSFVPALPEVSVIRNKGKNAGMFFQGQLDVRNAVFITYGVRAEWSPYYGEHQQPQVVPRYGIAYAREFGVLSAKIRGSYGHATRPPTERMRDGLEIPSHIPIYGVSYITLPNPDLGPEFQQGGEGGLELYFGNRGSLVITRYNQTVDRLIQQVSSADSARSLRPSAEVACFYPQDAEGHCWLPQSIVVNVGAIRNQGWELQGSVNLGPLTVGGGYTWAMSRMIGVTPRYRDLLRGTQYHAGSSFTGIAEHTWHSNLRYAKSNTSASININGVGQIYQATDRNMVLMSGAYRFPDYAKVRWAYPMGYRSKGKGYAMADLNVSHRLAQQVEGVLHMQNVTDFYQNDYNTYAAVMGRQTRVGLRLNWR